VKGLRIALVIAAALVAQTTLAVTLGPRAAGLDLVLVAVGGGVPLEPLDKELALPALGEVRLRLGLTITGGAFDLRADDGGRARAAARRARQAAKITRRLGR
jgi:hypothetical protein